MIISIDIDDILADSLTSFIEFYNQNHEEKIKYEDYTAYSLHEIIGIPKEEEAKIVREFDNGGFFKNMAPVKNSQKAIKKLSKKHKLIAVTARSEEQEEETRAWINKYFPEIKDILFTRNGQKQNKTKGEICKEIKADIHLDDKLDYAIDCANEGVKSLLFNYPWNRTNNLDPLITRVSGWDEAVEILNKIS